MRLGAAYTRPIPLDTADGVYVRNLTAEDIDAIDKHIRENIEADDFDLELRYKAEKLLCDAEGQGLEGLTTVDEMLKDVSRGWLRDVLQEAQETLVVGKRLAGRLRQATDAKRTSSPAGTA